MVSEGAPFDFLDTKEANDAKGPSKTLGLLLIDGALKIAGQSNNAKDGLVDTEGTSKGDLVGIVYVEDTVETEGFIEIVGMMLTNGALEVKGWSNGTNGAHGVPCTKALPRT